MIHHGKKETFELRKAFPAYKNGIRAGHHTEDIEDSLAEGVVMRLSRSMLRLQELPMEGR